MGNKKTITLTVNGRKTTLEINPEETLLYVLRQRIELKGTKHGCVM
jgi:aerobic-type carbon monoxide dehydrogenase small subunit (CoxS/CutS family)